jgi:hypothetical protein
MSTIELSRTRDRALDEGPQRREIDLAPLLGEWVIFAEETDGIGRVEFEESGEDVIVRAFGSGPGDQPDWGLAPARVFTDDVDGTEAWGFRASYDHGNERVELFGYLNRGLLAVEAGTTFPDGDPRSAYFTRTFMYRP